MPAVMLSMMLEWRSKLSASTNKLDEFLQMHDDERGCSGSITVVPGCFTRMDDFKSVFEERMKLTTFVSDAAVFATKGFRDRVHSTKEEICKSCGKLALAGCCLQYSKAKRIIKFLIHDMELHSSSNSSCRSTCLPRLRRTVEIVAAINVRLSVIDGGF